MHLTVSVEPGPAGFRATCTSPLPLAADGPTAAAAMAAVWDQYAAWLAAGGEPPTPAPPPGWPPAPPGSAAAVLAALARIKGTPMSDEYAAAIEEYRREHNTVPDYD